MASRQRDPGSSASGARKNSPPPPSWSEVDPSEDATRPILRTGSRAAVPWDAEEDAHQLLSELAVLPRAPAASELKQSRHAPLPPPVPDFDDEPSVTPSLRAPKDQPMAVVEPRKQAKKSRPGIAEFLRMAFAQRLYGSARYRLNIGELMGSPTAGKNKTREPMLLVPSDDSHPEILCGWLDLSRKEAQVRSYCVMALLHENRHGEPPEIDEDEYERFLDKLMDTLFDAGIRLVLLVSDMQDYENTQFNPVPAKQAAQPAVVVPLATKPQHSGRTMPRGAFLVAAAFALGLSAEHMYSWSAQLVSMIHAPSLIQQAALLLHG